MKPRPTFSFPDSSELHKIRTDKVADKHSGKTDTSQDQDTGKDAPISKLSEYRLIGLS